MILIIFKGICRAAVLGGLRMNFITVTLSLFFYIRTVTRKFAQMDVKSFLQLQLQDSTAFKVQM